MSLASTSQKQSKSGGCCGGSKKNQNKLAAHKGLKVKQNYVPNASQGAGKAGAGGVGNAANNAARNGGDEVVKQTIEAKLVLIGDSSVGKSSIAGRFQLGNFQDVYQSTIGGAYFQKELFVPESELIDENDQDYNQQSAQGHQRVKLHIWDTGGQEQFRSMLSLYYRDADAALICFDLSNPKSLQSVFYWVDEMNNNCNNDRSNFVLALAGNKCDLDDSMKKITYGTAMEVAEQHNMIYHETSAKSGTGVQDLFKEIVRDVIKCKRKNQQQNS